MDRPRLRARRWPRRQRARLARAAAAADQRRARGDATAGAARHHPLNKPVGYVSGQAEDGYEPAIVLVTPENRWAEDRAASRASRPRTCASLAPAGRLDIDSVGLLVLTQDGRIAKQLIGEDSEIEKEYLVRVDGPTPSARAPIRRRPAEHTFPARLSGCATASSSTARRSSRQGRRGRTKTSCASCCARARSARSAACASWSA